MTYSSEVVQIIQCDFCDPNSAPSTFRLTMPASDWELELFATGWGLLKGERYEKVSTHICPGCILDAVRNLSTYASE